MGIEGIAQLLGASTGFIYTHVGSNFPYTGILFLSMKTSYFSYIYFSTHIFQPPVGLLMPARERAHNRRVCVRESDNKRTQGMLVGC